MEKQAKGSEIYVIRYGDKYLAKGQDISFTPDLDKAEQFNHKGCAESFRDILGKKIEMEVVRVEDLEKGGKREGAE